MKIFSLERFTAAFGAVFLTFTILSAALVALPINKVSATTPSGPTKRLIVRYSQVLGANTDGQTVEDTTSGYVNEVYKFKHIPYGVYEADAEGQSSLESNGYIAEVSEEIYSEPFGDVPVVTIGANPVDNSFEDTTTTTTYDGTGYTIAVLDTGVDKNHAALSGKVVAEACFSTNDAPNGVSSLCPGAVEFATGADTALDCDAGMYLGCGHGTTVAGAAVMNSFLYDVDADLTDDLFSGVAEGANVVALQVFSAIDNVLICGVGQNPCVRTTTTNQLQALDYLIDLSVGTPIVAANMSLGGGNYTDYSDCSTGIGSSNYNAYHDLFSQLRGIGIAPIVAAGNSGATPGNEDKVSSPACVEGAVTVSATSIIGDAIASYANNGALTDLLAPGGDYDGLNDDTVMWLPVANTASSINGFQGTSQATPMVSGAFAVLREKHPNASVSQLVGLLQSTGTDVTDVRAGYSVGAKKLIDLGNALSTSTKPVVTSFTGPGGTVNEGSDTVLNVTATDYVSCSLDNGIGSVDISGGTITVPGFETYNITCTGSYNDTDTDSLTVGTFNNRPTQPSLGQPLSVGLDVDARTATITWEASTDVDGIDYYEVYLDGVLQDTTTELSYTFTDLGLDLEYTADVYAVDTLGARSLATSQGFVLAATSTPGVPDTGLQNILAGLSSSVGLSLFGLLSTGSLLAVGRRFF